MNKKLKLLHKIASFLSGSALVINSVAPGLSVIAQQVYAQEITPTPTPIQSGTTEQVTPTPTPDQSLTTGATGSTSVSGVTGATGVTGDTLSASSGQAGTSDATGETGITGDTGVSTPTGATGTSGDILDGAATESATITPPVETATPTPTPPDTTPTSQVSPTVNETGPPAETPTPTPTVTPQETEHGNLNAVILNNVQATTLNLSNVDPTGSATVTTDKADYAPTDTVVISGTGFKTNHDYTLEVTSKDSPPVDFTTGITTNDKGDFIYAYQLDGNYRPNYAVYIKQGDHIVAQTTFTDSIGVDFDQCANHAGGGYPDGKCKWIGSILNSGNSKYFEGMSVPQRILYKDIDSAGAHTISFKYSYTKGGTHAYDFITSLNQGNGSFSPGITDLNKCDNLGGDAALCNTLLGLSPTNVTVPHDPFDSKDSAPAPGTGTSQTAKETWYEGAFGNRQIAVYSDHAFTVGGSPIALGHSVGANGDTSDSDATLTLSFNLSGCTNGSKCNLLVFFGGHLAVGGTDNTTGTNWGTGLGSSSISGGPYHIKDLEFDGGGGSLDNQIQGADIILPGKIIINKTTVGGDGTFNYTSPGGSTVPTSFSITTSANTGSQTFSNVLAGTYTVTESDPTGAGFSFSNLTCTDPTNNSSVNLGTRTATINVAAGETVSCTYTNTKNQVAPTVGTTIHNANHTPVTSVAIGTTVHDSASVTGSNGTATGNVTFKWFTNGSCTGDPAATSSTFPLSSGSVDGTTFTQTPGSAGSYAFQAHYGGDTHYTAGDSACEPLTVTKIDPTFGTTIHDGSHNPVTSVVAGSIVHDSANASGTLGTPTGTVDFTFYTGVRDCSNQGAAAGTGISLINGIADPSSPEGPLTAGNYSFKAHYNGDSNYNAFNSACEPLSVTKLSPTISTAPHPSGGNIGDILNDSATLGGGYNATGSIGFNLYSPSDASCQSAPVYTQTVAVSGSGTYSTTPGFTSNASGTYHWTASYGGDSNNNAVASGCADEPVTINRLNSSVTTAIHNPNDGVVTSVPAGSTVHDSATVTAVTQGPTPTGNVDFTFYPGGDGCTGDSLAKGTVALNGNGVADPSTSVGPLNAGSYSFKAHYEGDNTYNPSDSLCEPLTVNQLTPNVSTIIHLASGAVVSGPVALGSSVSDEADVTGDFGIPTGTVDFAFYTSGDCSTGLTSAGTGVPLNGSGIASPSNTEGPLTTGSYSFKAHYNGNTNYKAGDSACEPLSVNKGTLTPSTIIHNNADQSVVSGPVALGTTVYDSASVAGITNNIAPTNQVVFTFFNNGTCDGQGAGAGSVALSGNIASPSNTEGPLTAGSYSFHASIADDANYTGGTSECEPLTVNTQETRVSTQVQNANNQDITGTSVALGTSVHDLASVSGQIGNIAPTGTVTYNFFTNGNCSEKSTSSETVGLGNPSSTQSSLGAGSYSYLANYSGDGNYTGSTGSCEPFTINKAQLRVSTSVHDSEHTDQTDETVPLGSVMHDTANVTGGVEEFALPDVSFTLTSNYDGESCDQGTAVGNNGTEGSAAKSADSAALGAGSYAYRATIASNDNYTGSNSSCEPFTVDKSTPEVSTTIHDAEHNTVGPTVLVDTVHDSATVAGVEGFEPTGTVDFSFFTDSYCEGIGTSAGSDVSLVNGIAHPSGPKGPLGAGFYAFRAHYNGDNNYDGANSVCEPFNITKLVVHKQVDDGSGKYAGGDEEANTLGFRWGLDGGSNDRQMGSGAILSASETHDVNENSVSGYVFTGWYDNQGEREGSCQNPDSTKFPSSLEVTEGQTRSITLCNQLQNPILTISKSNNAGGDKSPGDNVTFTIRVTATQSAAFNVLVTDLPAGGFRYRSSSWTANSTDITRGVAGDLKAGGITTEPTYASPGAWKLGNMNVGETVTLTYIADIDGGELPGLYKDLAWAYGCKIDTSCTVGASNSVLSAAVNPGFVANNFVGTDVNVIKSTQSGSSLKQTGQVLGASTELPATGSDTRWVAIAFFVMTVGLGLIGTGIFIRRKYA